MKRLLASTSVQNILKLMSVVILLAGLYYALLYRVQALEERNRRVDPYVERFLRAEEKLNYVYESQKTQVEKMDKLIEIHLELVRKP